MTHDSTASQLIPSLDLAERMRPPESHGCHGSRAQCAAAREAFGAMIVVLEAGARWPASFEAHRRGHADVAIIAQEPGESAEHLLRRTRRRVRDMRSAGRCARTVVLAASGDVEAPSTPARALIARTLAGSLCRGCGVLSLVATSPDPAVRRELRAVQSALEDGVAGVRVQVP